MLEVDAGNHVAVHGTAVVTGKITGSGNDIVISSNTATCEIRLTINGNHNRIHMLDLGQTRGLTVRVGNHRPADRCNFATGPGTTFEGSVQVLLYQDANTLTIGADCMVSNTLVFRGGEHPHLIFDRNSGEYLDVSEGIVIGDHVWIGEGGYITKNVSIAAGSIVAARAVVTRRFNDENVVIGGNPATIVRRDIDWVRNRGRLEAGSLYANSYWKTKARLASGSLDPEGSQSEARSRDEHLNSTDTSPAEI